MESRENRIVIPTSARFQLPKGFSYPLGAERISAALEGVPQFGKLTVCFFYDGSAAARRQLCESATPIVVLWASHTHLVRGHSASRQLMLEGHYTERWELTVSSVLSSQKHVVGNSLERTGLPAIRRWMLISRETSWRGIENFRVLVQPESGDVSTETAQTRR